MSYKKLEIWQLSKELAIDIHKMSWRSYLNLRCTKQDLKSDDLLNQFDQI